MIFVVLLSVIVVLLHLYLWKRLVKDTTRPGRARRVGGVLAVVLTLLVFATLILGRMVGPEVAQWFAWPGYIWFGLMVYLFVILALLELPRLALRRWVRRPRLVATATTSPDANTATPKGNTATREANTATPDANTAAPEANSRRLFLARGLAVVAGVGSAGLVGSGMVTALGPPEVRRLTVPLRALDPSLAGFRIAVVADIHLGSLLGRGHTERVVRMINETEPDLVAVVGDLVDGTVAELGSAVEPLRDLVSTHGSFFVTGNHEYYSGYEPWMAELERLGVHPLRNERTVITRGAAAFDLAGVNDVTGDSFADGPDFERTLGGRDRSRPVVLLAHQPIQVSGATEHGVDLQLSGHTHGGQLYPFHHVVQLAQPAVSGLSKVDDTWLYVTRGAGFWGPPVRVGAPPEITVVELAVT
jgi:predicted MPP superfamily phosphohydrolase